MISCHRKVFNDELLSQKSYQCKIINRCRFVQKTRKPSAKITFYRKIINDAEKSPTMILCHRKVINNDFFIEKLSTMTFLQKSHQWWSLLIPNSSRIIFSYRRVINGEDNFLQKNHKQCRKDICEKLFIYTSHGQLSFLLEMLSLKMLQCR